MELIRLLVKVKNKDQNTSVAELQVHESMQGAPWTHVEIVQPSGINVSPFNINTCGNNLDLNRKLMKNLSLPKKLVI